MFRCPSYCEPRKKYWPIEMILNHKLFGTKELQTTVGLIMETILTSESTKLAWWCQNIFNYRNPLLKCPMFWRKETGSFLLGIWCQHHTFIDQSALVGQTCRLGFPWPSLVSSLFWVNLGALSWCINIKKTSVCCTSTYALTLATRKNVKHIIMSITTI